MSLNLSKSPDRTRSKLKDLIFFLGPMTIYLPSGASSESVNYFFIFSALCSSYGLCCIFNANYFHEQEKLERYFRAGFATNYFFIKIFEFVNTLWIGQRRASTFNAQSYIVIFTYKNFLIYHMIEQSHVASSIALMNVKKRKRKQKQKKCIINKQNKSQYLSQIY